MLRYTLRAWHAAWCSWDPLNGRLSQLLFHSSSQSRSAGPRSASRMVVLGRSGGIKHSTASLCRLSEQIFSTSSPISSVSISTAWCHSGRASVSSQTCLFWESCCRSKRIMFSPVHKATIEGCGASLSRWKLRTPHQMPTAALPLSICPTPARSFSTIRTQACLSRRDPSASGRKSPFGLRERRAGRLSGWVSLWTKHRTVRGNPSGKAFWSSRRRGHRASNCAAAT
mmetsp:Transcript_36861/g.78248  ORF Transcript_36861/g.78248 Transcript_36861/m.78248 type:complete len:227 (-) Transcript_36861:386-1066(-)